MLRRTFAALSLVALPSAALAESSPSRGGECGTDAECPEGFACEVTGGSSCACAPDVPCDCAPVEYRSCVPGPCASDADCGEGMVCATYDEPCAGAAPCTSDGECPPPAPCEPTTRSVCAPRWVLPCESATECGAGFACEPIEMCECSGGGPVPVDPGSPDAGGGSDGSSGSSDGSGESGGGSSGSEATPPEESSCTCTPSEESWCRAIEIACEDASVCPSGWTCERWTNATDCAAPAPDGEGAEEVPCEPSEPASTTGLCVPPFGAAFDTGIPRGDDASAPHYESGSASPVSGAPNPTPTPGSEAGDVNEGGCQGGATLPFAGLGVLVAALWRRRATAL